MDFQLGGVERSCLRNEQVELGFAAAEKAQLSVLYRSADRSRQQESHEYLNELCKLPSTFKSRRLK